jgi:uncharacterized protein (TIGR03435 family)
MPCTPGERLTVDGARVDIRFMSFYRLILIAYRIKPYQLSEPDWMKQSSRFDIMAKILHSPSMKHAPGIQNCSAWRSFAATSNE